MTDNNQNPPTTDDSQTQNTQTSEQDPQQSSNQSNSEQDLMQDLAKMTNIAQRAAADLQNYKRQVAEERKNLMAMSKISVLNDILPVIDNLNRAIQHLPQDLVENEWVKGIQNIHLQFEGILTKTGLSEINCTGAVNPHQHEIVTAIPGEKDQIIEVTEKGYLLGDKVIRPAKVVVGNGE